MFSRIFDPSGGESSAKGDEQETETVPLKDLQWSSRSQEQSVASYGSEDVESRNPSLVTGSNIRFQVVIWYIGPVDAVLGLVEMKFRVTIFWNAPGEGDEELGYGLHNPNYKKVWAMHGRQRAYEKEITEITEGNMIVCKSAFLFLFLFLFLVFF
jgi:hypothetical protein